MAIQQGHAKVASLLMDQDVRGGSRVRLPALHVAAKKDDVAAARLLLTGGGTGDREKHVVRYRWFIPNRVARDDLDQIEAPMVI